MPHGERGDMADLALAFRVLLGPAGGPFGWQLRTRRIDQVLQVGERLLCHKLFVLGRGYSIVS